jgi:hypothetical protein
MTNCGESTCPQAGAFACVQEDFMNPKIIRLKEERAKNCQRIARLQDRNRAIDADILSIENTDIVGMVRENALTPDMLEQLIRTMKQSGGMAAVLHNNETEGN